PSTRRKSMRSTLSFILAASLPMVFGCNSQIDGGGPGGPDGAGLVGSPTGSPCTSSDQCASNGNDAICLDEVHFGQPSGLCSERCHTLSEFPFADDCLTGGDFNHNFFDGPGHSICQPDFDGATTGTCQPFCHDSSECRDGYQCIGAGIIFDSMEVGICQEA